jgi:hypothetical protein
MLKVIEIGLISVNIVKFSNSENFQFIANQPNSLSQHGADTVAGIS